MLSFVTGEKIKSMEKALMIYGTLKCEKENNLTLPLWATDLVLENLKEMHNLKYHFRYLTKPVQRIRTGITFTDISYCLDKKSSNHMNRLFIRTLFQRPFK